MELKDIVCDYELAKKLKELGVKQKSLFFHYFDDIIIGRTLPQELKNKNCALFTSDELLKMLPNTLDYFKYILTILKDYDGVTVAYEDKNMDSKIWFYDAKLSNALAKMLIWLIEKKYIIVEQVNASIK